MGRHILFAVAILITLSVGTEAFLHRDNSADLGGHAPINWTSCGGNAIAVNPLYLTQCDKSNCTLKIYKGYPGKFYMTPRYNHTYLNLYVTARSARTGRSLALLNTNGYEKEHYVMGNNFSLNFPLTFGKYFQTNWTNDLHTITVKVGSQEMEICRQFDVYLNSEVPNDGKEQGHGCWVVEAPCDFEHSLMENV
ncbi:unnamed protein product [Allacma fusca]|uniref:Uncharacterized protein n=1 Tax=Allacma fusca TaxID=39272 RepID=A0A8J2P071_9HEXA|nr:unnamed protein product [Allacma fusca]